MMIGISALVALAVMLALVVPMLGSEAEPGFPEIEGKALTGEEFRVPEDLTRPHNLLLIAFLREQQQDVDTWIPKLEKVEDANEDFTFYEFPVLPEMNRAARWFIYHGMRSGITSDRARSRTVTFHLDKGKFKKSLGIDTEDIIQVMLVDSTGVVTWRDSGTWTEEKEKALLEILAPPADE
jgi:hypothetical protein